MRASELKLSSHVTIQAHVGDRIFTTEAEVAKQLSNSMILRLKNVEQFDKYAEKTTLFSLCYKSGLEMNFISGNVELLSSASNPVLLSVDNDIEMSPIHSYRSHVRYPYEYDLVLSSGMDNTTVRSVDISSSGVGVKSDRPYTVGSTVYVDIYNPVTKKSRAFRAQVANSKQLKINEYFVGLMFYEQDQWILDFINDLQDKVLKEVY